MELLVQLVLQKHFSLRRNYYHFWWSRDKIIFHINQIAYYGIEFGKNMTRPLSIFNVIFLFRYYNLFTFLRRQILCQLSFKDSLVNHYIYHTINWCLMLMTLNVFSIFKFGSDYTDALFYRIKINSYSVYAVKKKTRKEDSVHF